MTLDARRLRLLHPSLLRHVLRAAFTRMRGTTLGLTHEHLEPLCAALPAVSAALWPDHSPTPLRRPLTQRRLTLSVNKKRNFEMIGEP